MCVYIHLRVCMSVMEKATKKRHRPWALICDKNQVISSSLCLPRLQIWHSSSFWPRNPWVQAKLRPPVSLFLWGAMKNLFEKDWTILTILADSHDIFYNNAWVSHSVLLDTENDITWPRVKRGGPGWRLLFPACLFHTLGTPPANS